MYSSSEVQFFDLLHGFLLRGAFNLLSTYFPSKLLFEGEHTPRCFWLEMLSLQAQHHQIGHEGPGHRTFDSRRLSGDLRLAQAHCTFQFLKTEFHRPPSEINCYGHARGRQRQIGHEQFGLFGAVVTPPSAKGYRDISYVAQVCMFDEGPEGSIPGVGSKQGHPHLAVMRCVAIARRYWALANFQVRGKAMTKNHPRA
jgi:hypothetical protein